MSGRQQTSRRPQRVTAGQSSFTAKYTDYVNGNGYGNDPSVYWTEEQQVRGRKEGGSGLHQLTLPMSKLERQRCRTLPPCPQNQLPAVRVDLAKLKVSCRLPQPPADAATLVSTCIECTRGRGPH